VLPFIVEQLSFLGSLMTKKIIPQQLVEVLNDFNAAFLPISQAKSCIFEDLEKRFARPDGHTGR
jgi:hypothetical protein